MYHITTNAWKGILFLQYFCRICLIITLFLKDSEEGEPRDEEDEEKEGDAEEGAEEPEPEEPVDTKKLDELSIAEGLSVLAKTADGLGHAYLQTKYKWFNFFKFIFVYFYLFNFNT